MGGFMYCTKKFRFFQWETDEKVMCYVKIR